MVVHRIKDGTSKTMCGESPRKLSPTEGTTTGPSRRYLPTVRVTVSTAALSR
ncbi:hypothetical protein [Plantactinospora mayteni]|uniref:hypothetical protein n=1 Tax=Plantactinospora mayteni TaxID=566021 RepID=UPI001944EAFE|nr:hypothetical protein [Plantactinospora mayteni]